MNADGHSPIPSQIQNGIWPASNERGFTIDERPARSPRRMKVIGIGAGMAGIATAMQVNERPDGIDLKIFDKAPGLGGNWYWNSYPGIACDNPGATYQFIKETHLNSDHFYSKGEEIRQYLQGVVEKNNLEEYFTLSTEVVAADWSDETSQWTVTLKDLKTNKVSQEIADAIISATGPLHHPKWPNLRNLDVYKGTLVHASRYPSSLDLKNKRVAVLGTGSTGVQIVPAILKDVLKLHHWIRQPTYIMPLDASRGPFKYSDEQKERFINDPEYFLKYRKALEHTANKITSVLIKGTSMSEDVTKLCATSMREKLASRPDIAEKIIPKKFSFGCRRPTPGPGYLEALCNPKVETHLDELQEMTERGFIDHNGLEHQIDVFICATGYESSYVPAFPIRSRGVNLQDRWVQNDPDAYLSIATPGFPNYFIVGGPWGGAAHGSAIPIAEVAINTFLNAIRNIAEEHIASMEVTEEATQDFLEYAGLWHRRTVFMEPCRSWWKASKSGLPLVFPGSRVSYMEALANLRPADWKYRYLSVNRFRFWGNGFHPKELGNSDDTYYLGYLNGKATLPDYGDIILDNIPHNSHKATPTTF